LIVSSSKGLIVSLTGHPEIVNVLKKAEANRHSHLPLSREPHGWYVPQAKMIKLIRFLMGLTQVRILASNPAKPELREEIELTVDTGSIFPWISKHRLSRLGLKPTRKRRFKTIDGRELEREVGLVTLKYNESEITVETVFAEEGDVEVLGVIALEAMGYRVNPLTGKLEYVGLLAA